jgi:hypothetical protein
MIQYSHAHAGPNDPFQYGHAVQVVGYNNADEASYWIAKNSWGSEFAERGFFKIALGAAGVCDPGDTAGLVFRPLHEHVPRSHHGRMRESNRKDGCFEYTAAASDYVIRVAATFGTSAQRVLLDNLDVISQPDMALGGKVLRLCGIEDPRKGDSENPNMESNTRQVQALLQVKASVDKNGLLAQWAANTGANGGFCKWRGVNCNTNGDVASINLGDLPVGGTLPPAEPLLALPGLETLYWDRTKISGTLPESWGLLKNLKRIELRTNAISGTLPASYSRLGALETFCIATNKVTGTLPAGWGDGMKSMVRMDMPLNALTGTLPAAWSGMKKLDYFDLAGNKLLGSLPAQWSTFTSLVDLYLYGNAFSGSFPTKEWGAGMRRLKNLQICNNANLSGCFPKWFKGNADCLAQGTKIKDC